MDFGQLDEDLFEAIKVNDLERVQSMLMYSKNLTFAGGQERSPLWTAAKLGHLEIVEILINSGADVNERRYLGRSVLHMMSNEIMSYHENHSKVAEILIRHGANVNAFDCQNTTPLQYAVIRGDMKWAEFLLQNGASLESVEWNCDSPIIYIMTKLHIKFRKEILLLFIKYGMNTSFVSKNGENLFHRFHLFSEEINELVEVAEILLKSGVSINEFDYCGLTPLHRYTFQQNLELISFFISIGADVNEKTKMGHSPLSIALNLHNFDMIELLLSKGAGVNALNEVGVTALHKACMKHDEKIIKFLIQKGADVNAESVCGKTPFFFLQPEICNYNACVVVMMKEFSKLSYKNSFVSEKNKSLIKKNSTAQTHFEKCITELDLMASTKFYFSYSYYCVMKMAKDIKKLAYLTKNDDFVSGFEKNLCIFSYFKYDLQKIFEEAKQVRDVFEEVKLRLYDTFGDFFPDIIIRKLAENLNIQDLPLQ